MRRLFVAIRLPETICARLTGLMGGIPGAHWTAPENLHLTLRFIGEVDDGRAADIDAALSRVTVAPFALTLSGIGTFGSGRTLRAVWVGTAPSEPLAILQGRVEAAVVRGGAAPETRNFTPHITLARLGKVRLGKGAASSTERVGRFISERGLFLAPPFTVSDFALMESHLGRQGPSYAVLRRYPDNPPPVDEQG